MVKNREMNVSMVMAQSGKKVWPQHQTEGDLYKNSTSPEGKHRHTHTHLFTRAINIHPASSQWAGNQWSLVLEHWGQQEVLVPGSGSRITGRCRFLSEGLELQRTRAAAVCLRRRAEAPPGGTPPPGFGPRCCSAWICWRTAAWRATADWWTAIKSVFCASALWKPALSASTFLPAPDWLLELLSGVPLAGLLPLIPVSSAAVWGCSAASAAVNETFGCFRGFSPPPVCSFIPTCVKQTFIYSFLSAGVGLFHHFRFLESSDATG